MNLFLIPSPELLKITKYAVVGMAVLLAAATIIHLV